MDGNPGFGRSQQRQTFFIVLDVNTRERVTQGPRGCEGRGGPRWGGGIQGPGCLTEGYPRTSEGEGKVRLTQNPRECGRGVAPDPERRGAL